MIKKFVFIKNVGKFYDCQAGGIEFGKETIIFGSNTSGKSTITAILRSLNTGKSDYVIGRKTFGKDTKQKIEILFENDSENKVYSFQSQEWENALERIEIFDSKFVSDNVYHGEIVLFEQQRNLNQLIIGERGKILKDKIDKLQEESDEISKRKREFTNELFRNFSRSEYPILTIEDFCNLSKIEDVDRKIAELEKKIEFEKNKEKIKAIFDKHISWMDKLPFDNFYHTLSKPFKVNFDKIEAHIKETWSKPKESKNFLQVGLNLTKPERKKCVFCGQDLNESALNLLNAYEQLFMGEYESFQKLVKTRGEKFLQWQLEGLLDQVISDFNIIGINIPFAKESKSRLISAKSKINDEIEKKIKDLNYEINFDELHLLAKEITHLKNELKSLRSKIFPGKSSNSIDSIKQELLTLKLTKKRFTTEWIKFSNDFNSLIKNSDLKRKERDKLREELNSYSEEIFDKHKKKINYFMSELGADFEIDEFKPLKKIVGKKERIFSLKFFKEHTVNVNETISSAYSFKNTMSDSDKRLLAFSFFLSLLSNDRNLDKKIIVFDDPISSFDEDRKRKTMHLLDDITCEYKSESNREISVKPLQKIILTHEKNFYRDLSTKIFPNAKKLRIEFDKKVGNLKCSKLVHCNVEKDFPTDEVVNRLKRVKKILKDCHFDEKYADDCRIILENIYIRKYYFDLEGDINSKKSIRTFVEKLQNLYSLYSENNYKRLIRLCDDLNIELHNNISNKSQGDTESILKDFFECLKIV